MGYKVICNVGNFPTREFKTTHNERRTSTSTATLLIVHASFIIMTAITTRQSKGTAFAIRAVRRIYIILKLRRS